MVEVDDEQEIFSEFSSERGSPKKGGKEKEWRREEASAVPKVVSWLVYAPGTFYLRKVQ